MRYFTDIGLVIWNDVKGLFGPEKAFYTFLGIGLATWLIPFGWSQSSVQVIQMEIGKALFLFCLIKIAVERSESIRKDSEIVKTLKRLGISRVTLSRDKIDQQDLDLINEAEDRIWLCGFIIDDLLNQGVTYSNRHGTESIRAVEFFRRLLIRAKQNSIKLRILALDPLVRDAYLHEQLDNHFVEERISRVLAIREALKQWDLCELEDHVHLSRKYPMTSIALGDNSALVQSWFFTNYPHGRSNEIGLFHCERGSKMVSLVEQHFSSIWDYESVTLKDYFDLHCKGVDCAIRALHINNMYVAKHEYIDATPRMLAILKETKEYLCIKQVSLRHLLTDPNLSAAFLNVLERSQEEGKMKIRLLFIDRNSEVAMMRSFGEYIHDCEQKNIPKKVTEYEVFKDYREDSDQSRLREKQALYRDTEFAMEIASELKARFPNCLEIKTYFGAPDGAIFLNEKSALYESLHYGAKKPRTNERGDVIFSGEMPLLEYTKENGTDSGQGYEVILSNFDFVWKYLSN